MPLLLKQNPVFIYANTAQFYGIFGDTNGDDNPKAVVGEASISMATLCFGKGMNGNSGHDRDDVLVLAFKGTVEETVPGANGADWAAQSVEDFISFTAFDQLGDSLVAKIGGGGSSENSTSITMGSENEGSANLSYLTTTFITSAKPTVQTPVADATASDSDLSGSDTTSSESCSWADHCSGATCSSDDDCSDELSCTSGKCT